MIAPKMHRLPLSKLCSTVQVLAQQILRNLLLPLVPVAQQFLLIVQQLLVRFGCEFKVGSLNNRINGARLLALLFRQIEPLL